MSKYSTTENRSYKIERCTCNSTFVFVNAITCSSSRNMNISVGMGLATAWTLTNLVNSWSQIATIESKSLKSLLLLFTEAWMKNACRQEEIM